MGFSIPHPIAQLFMEWLLIIQRPGSGCVSKPIENLRAINNRTHRLKCDPFPEQALDRPVAGGRNIDAFIPLPDTCQWCERAEIAEDIFIGVGGFIEWIHSQPLQRKLSLGFYCRLKIGVVRKGAPFSNRYNVKRYSVWRNLWFQWQSSHPSVFLSSVGTTLRYPLPGSSL